MGLRGRKTRQEIEKEVEEKIRKEVKKEKVNTIKVILVNDFHKTETSLNIPADTKCIDLTEKEANEIKEKLYNGGCNFCGNELGMRGNQGYIYRIDPLKDKGIKLTIIS